MDQRIKEHLDSLSRTVGTESVACVGTESIASLPGPPASKEMPDWLRERFENAMKNVCIMSQGSN